MNSKILIYLFVFFTLFFIGYNVHTFILEKLAVDLPYNLQKVYLFHAGFSTLICVNFAIFSNVDKVFQQLSFIYLATLVLKIILFSIVFYAPIFQTESLTNIEAISLLIPMFIFLLTEAFFVVNLLNKNTPKTIK